MVLDPNNVVEPILQMPEDELQNLIDDTWNCIETLYTTPSMKPEKTRGIIEQQVDFNLNNLICSMKKTLVSIYPKLENKLSEVVDANEAWWFKQSLEESRIIPTPLYEGITALMKTYLLLNSYKIDYRAEEIPAILSDFRDLEWAIKKYVAIAIGPIVAKGFEFTLESKEGFDKKVRTPKKIREAFADYLIHKHRHLNASQLILKILDEQRAILFDYLGIEYRVFRITKKDRYGKLNYNIHFQSSDGPFKCAMDTLRDTIRERQKKVQ